MIALVSCHNNAGTDPITVAPRSDTVNSATAIAPVHVAANDSLQTGLRDATKDYPGVKATADNGVISLTGTIKRAQLQPLMMSLRSLQPKKINNNLTVK